MSSRRPVSRLPSLQRRLSEDSPWEKRLPQPRVSERTGSGAKFLKSAGTGSHMHAAFTAAPAPHNRRRVSCKPFGKCSEMFGIRGASPTLPGAVVSRQIFGNVRKCSEMVGCSLSHPSPGAVGPLKMFGNVRKCSELGGGVGGSPPLPGAVVPRQMFGNARKCSEMGGSLSHPSPGAVGPLKMFGNVRN